MMRADGSPAVAAHNRRYKEDIMGLKNAIMPLAAQLITSDATRNLKRTLKGGGDTVTFYFRINDPFSVLLAQQLPGFCRQFGLQLQPRVMLDLPDEMYPEAELYHRWALRDAPVCAALHGLKFPPDARQPDPKVALAATRILLAQENEPGFLSIAQTLCRHLWTGHKDDIYALATHTGVMDEKEAAALLRQRADNFLAEGHYLTGTLHYGGEWYWGPDRLDHLARRLADKRGTDAGSWGAWREVPLKPSSQANGESLEFFFSFRSPYSYIALDRIYRVARQYRLNLKIRPVLPMVMRGLPVPKTKRMYILLDATREARLNQVPFGKICDPVGAGVERCMAIWPLAQRQGKLTDFVFNAATAIWSQGQDMASDRALRKVIEETQLDWDQARAALADDRWRSQADANRSDMMAAGCWGVPSFRYKDTMIWGQDRIPALIRMIQGDSL